LNTYQQGDNYIVDGTHNIGKQQFIHGNHQQGADPQQVLNQLIGATMAMREQASLEERPLIDSALEAIGNGSGEKSVIRRALTQIAGVAALVGSTGPPVIAAIQAVTSALGISF
jgi:hypothetical protein